ncbi:MAG TPA: ABC transporter ATP-binding protein [Marinospirillum sp.]|uniref:ABC transporter ATP-binding protein n=1 Tax=Marinospirillum sp. TaxID=2183934 RepID=UPI002B4890A2|nr:ABC transporter ATP-binding protein [Marinospirillum sp.]HKM15979.1 ABC transporter ATP-binding protein [Marinospirillum sp.]
MSFNQESSNNLALELNNIGRIYRIYKRPVDRLLQALPFFKVNCRVFEALQPLNLTVKKGEVIGLLGRNGAGKSTLLQLICGTLPPSSGSVMAYGRIAALLELGSGFNPEFTGRENIFLNGAILGLSEADLNARLDEIIEFSGIGTAVDQPVKTYSSGMFVRLAFSVAVCVDPDILVIDEALSVGDGAFARKSFERIMSMKEQGCTILFCSHNLYQVEAICSRAIWLHEGKVVSEGMPAEVIRRYENYLYASMEDSTAVAPELTAGQQRASAAESAAGAMQDLGNPRITQLQVFIDDQLASMTQAQTAYTSKSTLKVVCAWQGSLNLPPPSFAITLHSADGRMVASAGSHIDKKVLQVNAQGEGKVVLELPNLALLKGEFWLEAYLLCEQGIMFYDQVIPAARFSVASPDNQLEQGLYHAPRVWKAGVCE